MLFTCVASVGAQQKVSDVDKLGMAMEYFQSGKYHEALLLFLPLDKNHKLNPRFRAFIGLCYYYEWDYDKAVKYFDKVLPQLDGLAPHERSVYYYAAGESYFQLKKYEKAIEYFTKDLEVCYNNEKGDVYYRLGFCNMFLKNWKQAYRQFSSSEDFYRRYRNTDDVESRLAQITNMKNGCMKYIMEQIDDERRQMLEQSSSVDTTDIQPVTPWDSITVPSVTSPQFFSNKKSAGGY